MTTPEEPTDPPVEDPPIVELIIYCAVCGKVLTNLGPRYTHGTKAEDRAHTPEPTTEPGGGASGGVSGRNG